MQSRQINSRGGDRWRSKATLAIVSISAICVGTVVECRSISNESAKTIVVSWCRLAEFPSGRKSETLLVGGSAFTREFEISFQLERHDLQRWISDSPGLRDASIATNGRVAAYRIEPKDAQSCLVKTDESSGKVWIKAYWS